MRVGDVYALQSMVRQGVADKDIISNARFRHYTAEEIKSRIASCKPKAPAPEPKAEVEEPETTERPRTRRKVVGDE